MRFRPFVSLLVIAVLLLSILSPIVEASVVYGPSQFRGDWYSGAATNKNVNAVSSDVSVIANGSSSIVNGSKVANGSPAVSALPPTNSNNANPSIVYSTQYSYTGSNTGALSDYQRVMGQYCPEVQLDGTGGVKVGSTNNKNSQKNGLAGSNVVYQYLDNYVETDNFSIISPHGNYTMYLRNGDTSGKFVKNGTIFYVRLNGKDIFTPLDFSLTNQVLKKNVTVLQNDTLQVFAVGLPGSFLTLWLEDESPDIVITSPVGDTVSNGTITLAGYTTDHNVKTITVKQSNNSTVTSVPVSNGNFTTSLYIHAPVKLTLSETDSVGTLRTASLSLDGDYLPMQAELQYGFDPLNSDSDSKLTAVNEAKNGIRDGFEILDNQSVDLLPAFMKYLIGGDPTKVDSNGNGLTDYFEFTYLNVMNVGSNSSTEMALPNQDPDNDGLTNIQEQSSGTNPKMADTDGDGLSDGYEVNVSHTDPLSSDSDNDGLDDGTELKLGTNPNNQDSNSNGILDGNETYTSAASNITLGINVSINGIGDMSKRVMITQETSDYYTNNSALSSQLVHVDVNNSFNYAVVSMNYDPRIVTDPANYSLCYYNETYGLFLPVNSTVDPVNHTISANVTHLSMWGIFNLSTLANIYSTMASFNEQIAGYVSGSANIPQNTVNDPNAPITVTKTYTVDQKTNSVIVGDSVSFSNVGTTVQGNNSTPPPSPTSDYSVTVTMNLYGATNWFDNGASFPAGVYQINATGWYSHWSPVPSTMGCLDQGPDPVSGLSQPVCMYAWSNRGNNYKYANVQDKDRMGMHVKYGSNDSPVYAIRIVPGTLQFTSNGGPIGMWDYDDVYPDNTYNCTYILSYVNQTARSLNMNDSDGDGLPDDLETHGWMDIQSHIHVTDPYTSDSDGDGLSDGQEAGAWTVMNGLKYFQIVSDPNNADSDNDGLSDYDEVNGSVIYVANTHGSAQNFMNAVQQGSDATQYLTALTVKSSPLSDQSDSDGINDYDEIMMGTNPSNSDTDGDGIPDNLEAGYGEDPTIFDVTPPTVSLGDWNVYKDSFSVTTKYYFEYTVSDPAGVKDVSVVKNDIVKDSASYPHGITATHRTTYFETDWETLLDSLRTAKVDVNSGDWNGNSAPVMVYHRSSMYGQWAAKIGSDTFLSGDTSYSLGALSGFSGAVSETPQMVAQIANDPAGYLNNIKTLTSSLASDPALVGQLVASLPQTIKDEQELENPYSSDNSLHATFAEGWYTGYIAGQLFVMWAGGEVVKGITSSEQFAKISDSVLSKLNDAKAALKSSETFGVASKVGMLLADDSGSVEPGTLIKVLEKVKYAADKARVSKYYELLSDGKQAALASHEGDVGEFLSKTGQDGVSFVENIGDDTLQKMFSISSDELNPKLMAKLRIHLVELNKQGVSIDKIKSFVQNTEQLKDINGVSRLVKEMSERGADNFNGLGFQAERATELSKIPGNTIEIEPAGLGNRIDLKVTNSQGIHYIEQKAPNGLLKKGKLEGYLDDAQGKFSNPDVKAVVGSNPTKLEISVGDGLDTGSLADTNAIETSINNHMYSAYIQDIGPDANRINEIEVFMHDGTSIIGTKGTDGLFTWM